MNKLRRQLILSAPLFSTGWLVGCTGEDQSSPQAANFASAQALKASTGQTLRLTPVSASAPLDGVWKVGAYLVPGSTPKVQACFNGDTLHLCLVERVVSLSNTYTRALQLSLTGLRDGLGAFKLNTALEVMSNPDLSPALTALQYNAGTKPASQTVYGYGLAVGTGSITLTKASGSDLELKFSNVKWLPRTGTSGSAPMLLNGNTTITATTANADWM
jgi:hypothetical protein